MIEYSQSQDTETNEGEDLSFKVIGVGGSGANVLDRLALEGSDDAQLLVLNTDIRKLSSSVSSQKVQLGATLLKGMGTGGDPDLGRQAAIEAVDEIREAIRGQDMIFVCVGLGGGTGSGAAPGGVPDRSRRGCLPGRIYDPALRIRGSPPHGAGQGRPSRKSTAMPTPLSLLRMTGWEN